MNKRAVRTRFYIFGFRLRSVFLALGFAYLVLPNLATAATSYQAGFDCISSSVTSACNSGEAQFSVLITDENVGPNQAAFIFKNIGTNASSISEIYFDDGALLGIASILDDPPNVDFEDIGDKVSPPDLPDGNAVNPPFEVTQGFATEADNPAPHKGINPGEELTVVFDLVNNFSLSDVIYALLNDGNNDGALDLRIGIHATSFSDDTSASFINGVPSEVIDPVPLPASIFLLLGGLSALGRFRRVRAAC